MEGNEIKQWEVAEMSISYRTKVKPSMRPKISGSKDAWDIFKASWDQDRIEIVEQFKVLVLNRSNRVLGILEVATGGMSGVAVDPKIIFAAALKACACGIILAHNHPSGNLVASQADIELTRKMKEGGKLLDMQVLDHVILTSERYFSFADEGML